MTRRIIALVKKEFRFNWKVTLAIPVSLFGWCFLMWTEYQFEGEWEEGITFLTCWVVAGMGIMPINRSFDREKSSSTKGFLSSLPVSTKELYVANMITTIIYLMVLTAVMVLCIWIFGMPCGIGFALVGMSVGVLAGAVFILFNYLFNYMAALICLLGSMVLAIFSVAGRKGDIGTVAFFANPDIAIPACIAMVILALVIIAILCKIKRRLL